MSLVAADGREGERSTARSRRRSPKASASSGAPSMRCSPRTTRRKAWRPSSRSGRRSSRIGERLTLRCERAASASKRVRRCALVISARKSPAPPSPSRPRARDGIAPRAATFCRSEELADRLDRRQRRARVRARRGAGDHRHVQRRHAGEPALRVERGRAVEAERRRGIERERVGDARLRGADRARRRPAPADRRRRAASRRRPWRPRPRARPASRSAP